MYWKHFGLTDDPFSLSADSRCLFLTDAQREVLGALRESVETERGFAALIGPPGVGKTTLLHELTEQLRETTVPVFTVQTSFELIDILRLLLQELGQDATKVDAASLHLRFAQVLRHVARKGKRFLLVIDEAQALNPAALETIRLLSNIEVGRKKIVEAVFAGQHEFEELLARPNLQLLKQRIAAYGRLKPFTKEETRNYVMHRVRVVGGNDLFTSEALDVLADLSHGVPRTINIYGFQVLHAAIKKNVKSADAALTRQAIHEFEGWPLPGTAPVFERVMESPAQPERAPEEDKFFLAAKDPALEALLQNMRSERSQQRDRVAAEPAAPAPRLEPPAPPNFAGPPADVEVVPFSIAAAIRTAEPMTSISRTAAATAPAMENPVAPPKVEPLPAPPEPKPAAKPVVVAMPVKATPVAETKAEPAVLPKKKTTTTVTMRPRVARARRVRLVAAVALAVISLGGGGAFAYKFGWFTTPETASAAAVNRPAAASVPVAESTTPANTSAVISQAPEVMSAPVNSVVTRPEAPHKSVPTPTVAEITAGKARRLSEADPAPAAPVSLGMAVQPSLASALNPNLQAVALRPRVSEVKPAVAISQPKPVYPEMANRLRLTGEVVLKVQVNAQGKPAKVEVISGHPLLATAARNTVLSGWRFTPASVNGNNVESETQVRINFRGSR
jgi:TonB family protein